MKLLSWTQISLILGFLILTACGQTSGGASSSSGSASGTCAEDTCTHVNAFFAAASARGISIANVASIHLVDQIPSCGSSESAIGCCNPSTYEVQILKSFWSTASDSQKKTVVFHELGHCLLGKSHDTGSRYLFVDYNAQNPCQTKIRFGGTIMAADLASAVKIFDSDPEADLDYFFNSDPSHLQHVPADQWTNLFNQCQL